MFEWLDGRPFIRSIATVFHPEIDNESETPERARVKEYCTETGRKHVEVYRVRVTTLPLIKTSTPLTTSPADA